MKTKPFGFSLLLAAGLLAARAAQFGDFSYEADGAGVIITKYTGSGGAVTIPDAIHGLPVTRIGDSAFYDCTGLTSITIPDSVTRIGNSAFYECPGLTNVTIGNGVTSIGDLAFYGCTGLTSLTIPASVTSIGGGAFAGCTGLTSVVIPDSVVTLERGWGRILEPSVDARA